MKFTPRQRIQAYRYCIDKLNAHYPLYSGTTQGPYLCNLLCEWVLSRSQSDPYYSWYLREDFPEFYSCKPDPAFSQGGGAWFGGQETENILVRLMVLLYCIDACKYQIRCATV